MVDLNTIYLGKTPFDVCISDLLLIKLGIAQRFMITYNFCFVLVFQSIVYRRKIHFDKFLLEEVLGQK